MLFCSSAISLCHYSRGKYSGPQTEALSGERQRRRGAGIRRGVPSPADYRGLGSIVSFPRGVRGAAQAENAFCRIFALPAISLVIFSSTSFSSLSLNPTPIPLPYFTASFPLPCMKSFRLAHTTHECMRGSSHVIHRSRYVL